MGPHWLIVPLPHAISVISMTYDELKRDGKEISFLYVAADSDLEVIQSLGRNTLSHQLL